MNKTLQTTLESCAVVISGVLPQEKKKCALISYTSVLPGQLTPFGMEGKFGTLLRDTPCMEEQFLRAGDVLLKRLNPDCAVVFHDNHSRIIPSANVFAIRPGLNLNSEYLAFLLEKSGLLLRISQLSGIGTTVAALTAPQIAGGIIPLPPLELQAKLGKIWQLGKRKDKLLHDMLRENDRFLRALCGKIY